MAHRTDILQTQTGAPIGFLKPEGKRETLAVKALDEKRFADAAKHIAALPDTPAKARAWKLYLNGLLHAASNESSQAESSFLQAASLAFVWAFSDASIESSTPFRLAAAALERAATVQRRGERGAEAAATHAAAYHLRVEHGTVEEQWESALGQGMAFFLLRDHVAALRWHRRCLELAKSTREASAEKQALVHSQIAITSRETGRLDDALDAARQALALWGEHDIAAAAVAQAEFSLGDILVAQAECLADAMPESAASAAKEAVARLRAAGESLSAFAGEHRRGARLCNDRLEFAERLLVSLGDDDAPPNQAA